MIKALALVCYLQGAFSGIIHFQSKVTCLNFKNGLDNQDININGENKNYDCYCKIVTIDPKKVRVH